MLTFLCACLQYSRPTIHNLSSGDLSGACRRATSTLRSRTLDYGRLKRPGAQPQVSSQAASRFQERRLISVAELICDGGKICDPATPPSGHYPRLLWCSGDCLRKVFLRDPTCSVHVSVIGPRFADVCALYGSVSMGFELSQRCLSSGRSLSMDHTKPSGSTLARGSRACDQPVSHEQRGSGIGLKQGYDLFSIEGMPLTLPDVR